MARAAAGSAAALRACASSDLGGRPGRPTSPSPTWATRCCRPGWRPVRPGLAVPDAAEHRDLVGLELHPGAAAEAEPAPGQRVARGRRWSPATRAGMPSRMATSAGPWDSPAVSQRSTRASLPRRRSRGRRRPAGQASAGAAGERCVRRPRGRTAGEGRCAGHQLDLQHGLADQQVEPVERRGRRRRRPRGQRRSATGRRPTSNTTPALVGERRRPGRPTAPAVTVETSRSAAGERVVPGAARRGRPRPRRPAAAAPRPCSGRAPGPGPAVAPSSAADDQGRPGRRPATRPRYRADRVRARRRTAATRPPTSVLWTSGAGRRRGPACCPRRSAGRRRRRA